MKTVTAAIIIQNGRVLICRRAPGEKLGGFWEFPGGKLEPGENLKQCLERELREELDVESQAGEIVERSIYTYPHGEFELVGIKTELQCQDIKLSVHDKFEWVLPEVLLSFNLSPADIPLAEAVIKWRNK